MKKNTYAFPSPLLLLLIICFYSTSFHATFIYKNGSSALSLCRSLSTQKTKRCAQCVQEEEKEKLIVKAAVKGAATIAQAVTSVALAKQHAANPAEEQAIVAASISTIISSIAEVLLASIRSHTSTNLDPIAALRYAISVPHLRHAVEQELSAHIIAELHAIRNINA